jgi:hypothetical protein
MAPDLWKDVREKQKRDSIAQEEAQQHSDDDIGFNLNNYMPRSNDFINENSN